MYLWLVLSTFLAILAGYSLPMRADTPKLQNVPVASAHMSKMVINHRVALNYARKQKWPYYCEGATEGELITHCDKDKSIGFNVGLVDEEMVADYIPDTFSYNEDFLSEIMCFDVDGNLADNCKDSMDETKTKYLITYGDLHEKWLDSNSLLTAGGSSSKPVAAPNDDVIMAFKNFFGHDEFVGYVRESDDSVDIINYQGIKIFTIPENMWSTIYPSGICNEKYNGSCIAYVSVL